MDIKYYALSNCGLRKENQDKYMISLGAESGGFPAAFGVFDGMGGEQLGEKASEIAMQACEKALGEYSGCNLSKLTLLLNSLICKYMQEFAIDRMGSTSALLRLNDNSKAEICNVGDSRIYKIRNDEISQLSVDHIMYLGKRKVLTQHLGIPVNELVIEPYEREESYKQGDIFLVCSDGLSDNLSDDEICGIISSENFEDIGRVLIDKAMENGGKDNITLILCKII